MPKAARDKLEFAPPLAEAGDRARVSLTAYTSKQGLINAMIKAEEQAEEAGFKISWTHTLAREAHGIARRCA